jgi:hypothetical protein
MAVLRALFALTFLPKVAAGGRAAAVSRRSARALLQARVLRDRLPRLPDDAASTSTTCRATGGEFYVLSLLALLGMFLCASVNDFMSLFVSLEVVTVSFFIRRVPARRRRRSRPA